MIPIVYEVCQLQLPQLLSIGIPCKESEIILHNIQILRQSTVAVAQQQQMQHGMNSNYGNSMSHDPHGTGFQGQEALQDHPNYASPDNSCYNYGSSTSSESGQFYNQNMSQPMDSMMSSPYQQQYQGSGFPQQQYTDSPQFPNMGMPSPSSSSVPTSRHGYHGQVAGSPLMGQSNMHHSHPHLRKSGQSPQEVANNILHMAASSYPTNNTIQVPLSKNRSAPYHIPSRSPNYNTKLPDTQQHMCSDYGQGHFAYPSPPHQSQLLMQSREPRLSPISPASVGMMSSPHSHQSGRTVPSPNPCSMNSPSKGLIRSPGPHTQLMNSPQRGQYHASPMNTSGPRMISPVPPTQQLKVSVQSSVSQAFQQCYYGNMLNSSQYQTFQQPMSARYSPSSISQISDSGQYSNSPGSQGRNFTHSPGGRSGHFSNISSPYTPGSTNYLSPNQAHNSSPVAQNMTEFQQTNSPNVNKQCNSPLQSLQKLCMLPDSQVVDPKTIVKEACVSSISGTSSKNTDNSERVCINTPSDSNCSPAFSEQVSGTENELKSSSDSLVSAEMNYQPKKMMLLRAAKEELCSPQSEATGQYGFRSETGNFRDYSTGFDEASHDTEVHKTESMNESASTNYFEDKTVTSGVNENSDENLLSDNTQETLESNATHDSEERKESEIAPNTLTPYMETNSQDTESIAPNTLTPYMETNSQDTESRMDTSHTGKCDKDIEASVDASENVQLINRNIQDIKVQSNDFEVAYVSDSSPSDTESQIAVRKDTNKTYSKQETLRSFEINPRVRGDSTGSLSDEIANSDYEYEDHIGCDDIDTGFSDIEDKSNEMIEESVDDAKDLSSNVTCEDVVLDSVVITGTSWKPNGKGNTNMTSEKNHRRNGYNKRLPYIRKVAECDSDDVPSPISGDDVDGLEGPVGHDNGDGTVSVSRPSHIRQRKTPVKYKDTSFFQGDFVFVEEEEDYLQQTEPRRKSSRKSIDVNHNPKRNGVVKNTCSTSRTSNACTNNDDNNKTKRKCQTSADTITKNLDKTIKLIVDQNAKLKSEKRKTTCNVNRIKFLKKGKNGDFEVVKKVSVVETVHPDKTVLSLVPRSKQSLDRSSETNLDSKHLPSQNTAAVVTRSSKQDTNVEKDGNEKRKVTRRQINGVNADSLSCEKVNSNKSQIKDAVVNQREKVFKSGAPKSKEVNEENKPVDEEVEVIEIDSDDSEGADNNGAENKAAISSHSGETVGKSKTCTFSAERQSLLSEEESGGRNFMFSLVEDDTIDETLGESLGDKVENNTEVFEQRTSSVNVPSKKTESRSNLSKKPEAGLSVKSKTTISRHDKSKQSGKGMKRKAFIDNDPDFDFGPSKRPFKSLKLDKSGELPNSSKAKKKTDKWANFKGPKIIFEGEKETPKQCVVINDPYEETVSKKSKTITQNVTRIEISQLPSDKSVLIPHNDTSENEHWTCALCGKHSSFKFLGDLFGPYTVETMSDDMLDLSPNVRLSTKKRKSEERQFGVNKSSKSGKRSDNISHEVNEWKEVWVHESCSVYSDGVFLIGTKIYGLQEAVRIASQTPCSLCNEMGAMIGCLNKGCQQKFHHACAQEAECYLDEENFSLLCLKHKVKKLKQLEASTSAGVG